MSTQNMYLRLLAGAVVVAVIAIAAMPERTIADGSDQQLAAQQLAAQQLAAQQLAAQPLAAQPLAAHAECTEGECSQCQTGQTLPFRSLPQITANPPRLFHATPVTPQAIPPVPVPMPQYATPSVSEPLIQSNPSLYPQGVLPNPIATQPFATRQAPPQHFVRPASVTQAPPTPPAALITPRSSGIPEGSWTNATPLGDVKLTVKGNRITFAVEGSVHLGLVKPTMCGEFSVASDNTIYGLIHSVDLGIPAASAAEMGEEMLYLNGLSDIPFSMRVYSDDEVLAIKSVTFGLPFQLLAASDGDFSEILVYAQSMVTGQYSPEE